jgi:hypothetical protein
MMIILYTFSQYKELLENRSVGRWPEITNSTGVHEDEEAKRIVDSSVCQKSLLPFPQIFSDDSLIFYKLVKDLDYA